MKKQTLLLSLALAGRGQELLPNPPQDYLICISHPIPGIVYVGGWNGLYKSIDNGDNWENIYAYDTTATPFMGICFYDENNAFASTSPNPKNKIYIWNQQVNKGLYKSTDGGLSWILLDTSHYFRNIQFESKDTIFAIASHTGKSFYDGVLCRSFNGGLSWEEMDILGNDISDYSFVPPSTVYAIKGCEYFYATPTNPIVYKSSDFGTTWSTVFPPDNSQPRQVKMAIDQIHFFKEGDGVLMGHYQIFTEDDFITHETTNAYNVPGGYTGHYDLVIQSKYLNNGCCVASSWDIMDPAHPTTIRLSKDKGHHYTIRNVVGADGTDISGCEQDTTFFVVSCQGHNIYRIKGPDFPNVGIEDHEHGMKVSVTPNPLTDYVRIISEQPVQRVWIIDVTGRVFDLKDLTIPQTDFRLNTSSWPSGLYLLELLTSKGRITAKIVKK